MFYMTNRLGVWQTGDDRTKGKAEFWIFFPKGFDPEIKSIRVAGDFQNQISQNNNWDYINVFLLAKNEAKGGASWTFRTNKELKL